MIRICSAQLNQIDEIMSVYDYARHFMKKNGNPTQWGDNYPSKKVILRDIENSNLYTGIDENGDILFVFAFIIGLEPSYQTIEQGEWLNSDRYGTIHRIASNGIAKGVFCISLEFCKKKIPNIRIDTHRDNRIMRHLIKENGFRQCGIIHLQDGSERIAYQYASCTQLQA